MHFSPVTPSGEGSRIPIPPTLNPQNTYLPSRSLFFEAYPPQQNKVFSIFVDHNFFNFFPNHFLPVFAYFQVINEGLLESFPFIFLKILCIKTYLTFKEDIAFSLKYTGFRLT